MTPYPEADNFIDLLHSLAWGFKYKGWFRDWEPDEIANESYLLWVEKECTPWSPVYISALWDSYFYQFGCSSRSRLGVRMKDTDIYKEIARDRMYAPKGTELLGTFDLLGFSRTMQSILHMTGRGLTQTQIAAALGVSRQRVSQQLKWLRDPDKYDTAGRRKASDTGVPTYVKNLRKRFDQGE